MKCCKDCKERVLGCHSTCKTYIGERKELDELKYKKSIAAPSLASLRYDRRGRSATWDKN